MKYARLERECLVLLILYKYKKHAETNGKWFLSYFNSSISFFLSFIYPFRTFITVLPYCLQIPLILSFLSFLSAFLLFVLPFARLSHLLCPVFLSYPFYISVSTLCTLPSNQVSCFSSHMTSHRFV